MSTPNNTRAFAPAFDVYPERWLAGVMHMTDHDQIRYWRLLCHSWIMDGLPNNMAVVERLAGGEVSDEVRAKFVDTGDGKLRNLRLEEERGKQMNRIAAKRKGAQETNAKRWGKLAPGAFPALEEVKRYAPTVMATDAMAEKFWCDQESVGWRRNNQPVVNWQALFRSWVTTYKSNDAARKGIKPGSDNGAGGLKKF